MSRNKGSAILMTIGITAVLLVLAGAFLGLAKSEGIISARHADCIKSQYLAEAGIARAKCELSKGVTWPSGVPMKFNLPIQSSNGEIEVTVTSPSEPGYLEIKSTGKVPGRSAKTIELRLTPPAKYTLYSKNLVIDRPGAVLNIFNHYGVELDDIDEEYGGTISFSESVSGAYQQINDTEGVLVEPPHVHCYKPPKVDTEYMLKADHYRSRLSLGEYNFECVDGDLVLSGSEHKKIIFVKGNAAIIATDTEQLSFEDCVVITKGDIVLLNIGAAPAHFEGMLFAGGNVQVVQKNGFLDIVGALSAGQDIEFDVLQGVVNLSGNPNVLNSVPSVFKENLGYLMSANE
ncbi:MAG: hypothetical protein ACM3UZ_08825 [Acidobacteriota bacterium]